MEKLTQKQIDEIRKQHCLWLATAGKEGERADLNDKNLEGANLTNANMKGADMQEANLTNANMEGANLQEANLTNANMKGTNLQRAIFDDADLEGAIMPDGEVYQGPEHLAEFTGRICKML